MTDHNTRAAKMWEFISAAVDFRGKTVLDAGCGYGDFTIRAAQAGASFVVGIDSDPKMVEIVNERRDKADLKHKVMVANENLNRANKFFPGHYDIVMCFSVLPYLDDFIGALRNIRKSANDLALIECQYFEDGPGLAFIKDDTDMRCALERAGFANIEAIGATNIKDRGKMRTIWRCEV